MTATASPWGKVGEIGVFAVFRGGFVLRVALSPALAPARSRLGKALSGLILSVLMLHPGRVLPVETVLGQASGVAEAATSSKTTTKKPTKHATMTTHKKSAHSTKKKHAYVRTGNNVNARAALLIDAQTGEVLYDKNSGTPMPIASLTKMMT